MKCGKDGMRQNTPTTIKTSVGEAAKVLDSLLNTHNSKGEKKESPSPPEEQTAKKGKGSLSPSYAGATMSQAPKEVRWWERRKKKKKLVKKDKNQEKKGVLQAQGKTKTVKRSTPAGSGDTIKVSVRDGPSYADILREMKAKVDHRKADLKILSIRRTRKVQKV